MVRKRKKLKRQKLGEGFVWFRRDNLNGPGSGFTDVRLTNESDGYGGTKLLRVGKLGGWQKVKLYAEWMG